MDDNHQQGSKLRSRPSANSISVPLLHKDYSDLAANPYPPSQLYQQASPSSSHYSSEFSTITNNSQSKLCMGNNSGSMWQHLMVGAGSTAAVLRTDAIKCIKYCLSWVQYGIQHIEQQTALLRAFLVSLASSSSSSVCVLSTVKKEVVDTLRKVVDVISRYAGTSLPYHAKLAVRGFILNLPSRWASLNDFRSSSSSPVNSPVTSILKESSSNEETTTTAAMRLVNFSQESVDMLRSISGVFSGTEAWLGRLLYLRQPLSSGRDNRSIPLAPISTSSTQ